MKHRSFSLVKFQSIYKLLSHTSKCRELRAFCCHFCLKKCGSNFFFDKCHVWEFICVLIKVHFFLRMTCYIYWCDEKHVRNFCFENFLITYIWLVTLTQHFLVVDHLRELILQFSFAKSAVKLIYIDHLKIMHLVSCVDELRFGIPHVVSNVVSEIVRSWFEPQIMMLWYLVCSHIHCCPFVRNR